SRRQLGRDRAHQEITHRDRTYFMPKTFGSAFTTHLGRIHRYNLGARSFHWLIALMIAGMYFTNTMRESYERGSPMRDWWLVVHASLGISIFVVTLGRIIWR